jgi:hypothetical protein
LDARTIKKQNLANHGSNIRNLRWADIYDDDFYAQAQLIAEIVHQKICIDHQSPIPPKAQVPILPNSPTIYNNNNNNNNNNTSDHQKSAPALTTPLQENNVEEKKMFKVEESRVEESKVKESKVEESKAEKDTLDESDDYNNNNNDTSDHQKSAPALTTPMQESAPALTTPQQQSNSDPSDESDKVEESKVEKSKVKENKVEENKVEKDTKDESDDYNNNNNNNDTSDHQKSAPALTTPLQESASALTSPQEKDKEEESKKKKKDEERSANKKRKKERRKKNAPPTNNATEEEDPVYCPYGHLLQEASLPPGLDKLCPKCDGLIFVGSSVLACFTCLPSTIKNEEGKENAEGNYYTDKMIACCTECWNDNLPNNNPINNNNEEALPPKDEESNKEKKSSTNVSEQVNDEHEVIYRTMQQIKNLVSTTMPKRRTPNTETTKADEEEEDPVCCPYGHPLQKAFLPPGLDKLCPKCNALISADSHPVLACFTCQPCTKKDIEGNQYTDKMIACSEECCIEQMRRLIECLSAKVDRLHQDPANNDNNEETLPPNPKPQSTFPCETSPTQNNLPNKAGESKNSLKKKTQHNAQRDHSPSRINNINPSNNNKSRSSADETRHPAKDRHLMRQPVQTSSSQPPPFVGALTPLVASQY